MYIHDTYIKHIIYTCMHTYVQCTYIHSYPHLLLNSHHMLIIYHSHLMWTPFTRACMHAYVCMYVCMYVLSLRHSIHMCTTTCKASWHLFLLLLKFVSTNADWSCDCPHILVSVIGLNNISYVSQCLPIHSENVLLYSLDSL